MTCAFTDEVIVFDEFVYKGDVDESLDEVDVGEDSRDDEVNDEDELVAEFTFVFAVFG